MSIAKKKPSRRSVFESAIIAETRALWMNVDLKRFVNGLVFGVIFALCVLLLNYTRDTGKDTTLWDFAGNSILILVICTIYSFYLVSFETRRIKAFRSIASIGAISIIPVAAAAWFPSLAVPAYLVPVTMTAFIFGIVYTERTALTLSLMLCLLVGISLEIGAPAASAAGIIQQPRPHDLVLILFGGAAVAAFGCGKIRKRSKLLKVGLVSSLVQIVLIIACRLRDANTIGDAISRVTIDDCLMGFFNGVGWAVLVTAILPLIEQAFKVATDISLLELSDQNHPLLRRLSLEAPGTYHHSLILGNLAEAAGEAVGANSLLLRVGAYFHDVGKLMKPEYFVENEGMQGSMHTSLSPTMSSLIIAAHTRDGAELAREAGLPEQIIDMIQQHHGSSLVEYFYRQARDMSKGARVDEELFRHPGPKPQSKEAGVLMLADIVESASRALPEPTPSRIARQVDDIINRKLMDGQLDECELTLTEVHKVQQTLVRSLTSVFHGRIKYPEPDRPAPGRGQNGR
ncbi:MAG TPA: HDIG domain-containing protein [Planctomycetota bacterium]|nr:HDIG domain-containing protein [Planctomycetota bacterium]